MQDCVFEIFKNETIEKLPGIRICKPFTVQIELYMGLPI